MTKSDLIARLAARYPQLVAKDADFAVKTILDAMGESLARGQRIEIRGFGSFGLNYRPPRVGRNPKSGAKVQVPEKRVPLFKAGKELRDRVDAKLSEEEDAKSASTAARTPAVASAGNYAGNYRSKAARRCRFFLLYRRLDK
jgi:integration host factor subunit beta